VDHTEQKPRGGGLAEFKDGGPPMTGAELRAAVAEFRGEVASRGPVMTDAELMAAIPGPDEPYHDDGRVDNRHMLMTNAEVAADEAEARRSVEEEDFWHECVPGSWPRRLVRWRARLYWDRRVAAGLGNSTRDVPGLR
jgi:hypothetical protein